MTILEVMQGFPPGTGTTDFFVNLCRQLILLPDTHIVILTTYDLGLKIPDISLYHHVEEIPSRTEIDVVHVHALWASVLTEAHRWARRKNIPVVVSPHGALSPWAMSSKRLKKLPYWLLFERWNLKRAAAFHVTAELEGEWVRERGFLQRQYLVPLGVDLPAEASHPQKAPRVILYVGRIYSVKGLDRIAAAIKILKSRGLWHGWHMVMAGPDWLDYQATFEQKLASLGLTFTHSNLLDDQVAQLGPVSPQSETQNQKLETVAIDISLPGAVYGEAKANLFRAASIYVQASHTENFAQPVAEALSYGVPVIAAKGTPWAKVVEHGCGFWVENSPEKLADSLAEMMAKSDDERREMGARGRAWMAKDFSWPAVGRRMLAAYRDVVTTRA